MVVPSYWVVSLVTGKRTLVVLISGKPRASVFQLGEIQYHLLLLGL